jgi:hypothetical protein
MFPPELEHTKPDPAVASATRHGHRGIDAIHIVFIGFLWVLALLHGFTLESVAISAIFSALWAMACYLEAVPRNESPSTFERALAAIWRWTRAIMALCAMLVFVVVPVVAIVSSRSPADPRVYAALGLGLFISVLAVWIGIFGWSRSLSRDRKLHEARKKRYGWRF